ncbi:MAG: SGNH/GDSL hydrolase family protein [Sulfitobacter sp.]
MSMIGSLYRLVVVLGLVGLLSHCTDVAPRGGGDILVIGDSVMAWNGRKNSAIGDAIARTLGRKVVSKAVPGAQFDNASVVAGAVGFDIQRQFQAGRWNWVVMNGTANDLAADCNCGACGASVNALIAPDANAGAIPDFIRKVRRDSGAKVLWMGYYAGSGTGGFAGCRGDLVEIERRLSRFARANNGVYFADAEDVISRGDATLFAPDNTHPSPKGSALIGAFLAAEINARDPRSQTQR